MSNHREQLGRVVREAWVKWAREHPVKKRSWLAPWEEITPSHREVDMQIGEAVEAFLHDAGSLHPECYSLDEVLKILKNMGHDVECGACMSIAFTGSGSSQHICKVAEELKPERRRELATLMSALSEEAWCAGWMMGLEFQLWRFVVEGPGDFGLTSIDELNVDRLRALSKECGGWFVWGEDDDHERFVSLDEWLLLYEASKE